MGDVAAKVKIMRSYWDLWSRHREACGTCNRAKHQQFCKIGSLLYRELKDAIDAVMKASPEKPEIEVWP